MDLAADLATEAKLHTRGAGSGAVSGVKDFGSEFVRQLFGFGKGTQSVSGDQLASLNSNDKALSDAAYAQTRAQVMALYETYRQKRLKEEEEKKEKERIEAQKKMQRIRGETMVNKVQKQQDIATAMGRASAETGKSYGSE